MKTAICAIIKDEHLYLKEWIDWHLNVGFDAIHLFEDKGSKSHEEICEKYSNVYLRRYEDDEEIRHILRNQGTSQRQLVLYEWFAKKYKDTYGWVAFIDADEFVFFGENYSLNTLCEEFADYKSVLLNWRMMGANGHIVRPGGGIIESYTTECGSVVSIDKEWMYKSFVNLSLFEGFHNLHRAYGSVNTHHSPNFKQLHYDKAWLNHYFTKSWEDWCDRIFKRGGTLRGHRKLTDFFKCNTDMLHLKKELVLSVADRIPTDTYWIDREQKIIAGGNVKKIMNLNKKING